MPQKKNRNRVSKNKQHKYGFHMRLDGLVSGADLDLIHKNFSYVAVSRGYKVSFFTKKYARIDGKNIPVSITKHLDFVGALRHTRRTLKNANDRILLYNAQRQLMAIFSYKPGRVSHPIVARELLVLEPRNKTKKPVKHITYGLPVQAEQVAVKLIGQPLPVEVPPKNRLLSISSAQAWALRVGPHGYWIFQNADVKNKYRGYGTV